MSKTSSTYCAERAVVLGGSLAGLLSARVLSTYFREVVIVERDALPSGPVHRRGVPQSTHAHGLLAGGRDAVEQLCPGWLSDVRAARSKESQRPELLEKLAVQMLDDQAVSWPIWWIGGVTASRPLIEQTLRARVLALPGVQLRDATRVIGLRGSRVGRRVVGVDTSAGIISADLVVDATGRASQLPSYREALGFSAAPVSEVDSKVQYGSCLLEPPLDFDPAWFYLTGGMTRAPHVGAAVLRQEDSSLILTLAVPNSERTLPDQRDEYRALLATLPHPDVVQLFDRSRMLSPIRRMFTRTTRFIRYDRAPDLPAGLLALGDAVCALNPVYGQGMTSAARCALALDRVLAAQAGRLAPDFERKAARAIAEAVEPAWRAGVSNDVALGCSHRGLRFPQAYRAAHAYVTRLQRVAAHDPTVALAFAESLHMLRDARVLFSPRIARRVLWPRTPLGTARSSVPALDLTPSAPPRTASLDTQIATQA